jgi:hypothetical protein
MLHVATVADQRARYYLNDLGEELSLLAPGRTADGGR